MSRSEFRPRINYTRSCRMQDKFGWHGVSPSKKRVRDAILDQGFRPLGPARYVEEKAEGAEMGLLEEKADKKNMGWEEVVLKGLDELAAFGQW